MDSLQKQMEKIAGVYTATITKGIKANVKKVVRQSVRRLKAASPTRTRRYARNWTYKKAFEDEFEERDIVFNKAPTYRLTHLLEKGHRSRNGGWVTAQKHIQPVEEWAIKEFEREVRRTIEDASK